MFKPLFKTLVAVLAIAAAAAGPARAQNANVSWVLTPYGDLQTGDTVVIVDKTSERAMTNNNGSYSSPSAVEIGLSSDQNALSDAPAATLQWVVERDNGNYMFKVPGTSNYLYCTSDNDGVRVGSGNKSFEFQNGGDNNVPFLKNNATSRYLGLTNAYLWRCPSSISSSSIKNNVISFYKKTVVIIPTYTVRFASGNDGWTVTDVDSARSATAPAVLQNVMAGDSLVVTAPATLPGKVKSVKAVKYVPPAATVTTAPTATAAYIEAGSTTALVNAGAANGGTMMYAVTTTNAQPASTADFSATRPTAQGRTAGTYYVWYYAKADADHSDSEIAGPVSVTLAVMTTVTINQSDWGTTGRSFTKDGVTVSVGNIDRGSGNLMGGGTFSTTLGKFTRIVVTTGSCEASGTGWSGSYSSMTWAGTPASTVSFNDNFMGMGMVQTTIVCTIASTN